MSYSTKQIIAATIAVVAYALGSTSALAQKNLNSDDKKVYEKALSLAEKTNNRAAVGLLRDLYKTHPDNIDIAYNLGLCYVNMSGNPDSALFFLTRTLELDKKGKWTESRIELMLAIARTQQLCGKPDEAIKIYDNIEANVADTTYSSYIAEERRICATAQILMNNPVRLELHCLDSKVNSEFNDYRPVLSDNEDTLYFTSRRYKPDANKRVIFNDGQYEEAVYVSVRKGDKWTGSWGEAHQVRGLVVDKKGNAGQETATSFAKDELYICHDGDIYVSKRDAKGEWQAAEKLPEPINTQFNEGGAFVTEDGQTMYFSSDIPTGHGGSDIYVSHRLPNGTWGDPLNLGPGINSEEDEDSPFFHEATNTLYFCSNGHNTMGGFDIFFAPMSENMTFEAASNMGYPINSADDDKYFTPSKDRDRAYYASIRWQADKGYASYNIYEVEFDEPEQDRMSLIASSIEAPDLSKVSILTIKEGEVVAICYPNKRTGRFVSIINTPGVYEFVAISGNDSIRQTVTLSRADTYKIRQTPIELDNYVFKEQLQAAAATEAFLNRNNGDSRALISLGGDQQNGRMVPGKRRGNSPWRSWITTEDRPYTVQILSLRKRCKQNAIKGLEKDSIAEYVYRDGWYVYSYGSFATYKDALDAQQKIRKTTSFKDSFSRNSKQYPKYIKKEDTEEKEKEEETEAEAVEAKDDQVLNSVKKN